MRSDRSEFRISAAFLRRGQFAVQVGRGLDGLEWQMRLGGRRSRTRLAGKYALQGLQRIAGAAGGADGRQARHAGSTKYPLGKMLGFAVDGITSFSYLPLRLATWAGFAASGFADEKELEYPINPPSWVVEGRDGVLEKPFTFG